VLPGGLAGTAAVMDFIARQVSQNTYLSLIRYIPNNQPANPLIHDPNCYEMEFLEAADTALKAGLRHGSRYFRMCEGNPNDFGLREADTAQKR
jgi:hypothetical protein